MKTLLRALLLAGLLAGLLYGYGRWLLLFCTDRVFC